MQQQLPGIITNRARRRSGAGKEPLQVRIPAPLKRKFKAHAAMRGIEPNELFVEVWQHYEDSIAENQDQREPRE